MADAGTSSDGGDDEKKVGDGNGDAATETTKPKRLGKKRKLLKELADEELQGTARLMAGKTAESIRAIFAGDGIGTTSVDAEVFNESASGITRLLATLTGGSPQYVDFGFTNSVFVDITASEDELSRAATGLDEYEKAEDDDDRVKLARGAFSDTMLAALAAESLIEGSKDDVLKTTLSYGSEVTDAYKALVKTLASEEVSMKLIIPDAPKQGDEPQGRPVVLDNKTAEMYRDALSREGTTEDIKITAHGTLTMADSGRKLVRLTLDREAAKDPAIAQKHFIVARYSARAYRQIRKDNLWDQHVTARFLMTRDKLGTTAKKRPPSFQLISATARF